MCQEQVVNDFLINHLIPRMVLCKGEKHSNDIIFQMKRNCNCFKINAVNCADLFIFWVKTLRAATMATVYICFQHHWTAETSE